MKLQNKIAIVTGAGKGIGKGIALELAAPGRTWSSIIATAPPVREETVRKIRAMGRQAVAVQADVAQAAQVEGINRCHARKYGKN